MHLNTWGYMLSLCKSVHVYEHIYMIEFLSAFYKDWGGGRKGGLIHLAWKSIIILYNIQKGTVFCYGNTIPFGS